MPASLPTAPIPQPPLECAAAAAAGAHLPGGTDVSHVLPAAQSSLVAHWVPHVPPRMQRYGAHACGGPASPPRIDELPSAEHVADGFGAHSPAVQMNPAAQSASAAQLDLHFVAPSQAKLPAHDEDARHGPAPSQT
jgi:hypothetical protein